MSDDKNGSFQHAELPKLKSIVIYDYNTYSSITPFDIDRPSIQVVVRDKLSNLTIQMASWEPHARPHTEPSDTSQYLFTSGTTGLPKAAVWPAAYALMGTSPGRWPNIFKNYRRYYLCTPMFHGGAAYDLLFIHITVTGVCR